MTDAIFSCHTLKDGSDYVIAHIIYYKMKNGSDTTTMNVRIEASQMNDPTDINEAKTLADPVASRHKAVWFAAITPTITVDSGLNGPVTL